MTNKARQENPMAWISVNKIKPKKEMYEMIAIVETENKEEAFMLSNHIDSNWLENKEVTSYVKQARSTSVGDIMQTEDGLHLVDGCGFCSTRFID